MQESNFKRFVEVGRVVLLNSGPSSGRIAVIAEIIDHNRVRSPFLLPLYPHLTHPLPFTQAIIDGPSTSVPRQSFPFKHLTLTPLTVTLPRAAGTAVVLKSLTKEGTVEKWNASKWAQKREAALKRKGLSDFERFKVMVQKRQRRDVVRKAVAKA